jgi:hypothetical protein
MAEEDMIVYRNRKVKDLEPIEANHLKSLICDCRVLVDGIKIYENYKSVHKDN